MLWVSPTPHLTPMPQLPPIPPGRPDAIETLLLWEGRVSRARLLDLFGMHETQASRDIQRYRAAYPKACIHDLPSQSYKVSPIFRPTFTSGDFASYQRLIGAAGRSDGLKSSVPVESTQLDATKISHVLFREIHQAMRDGRAIRIRYRSLTTPSRHERTIRPHALIQAGARWHLRAWCAKAGGFRDFNLGRISAADPVGDVLPGPEEDQDWQTQVKVRLVPHSGLSPEQAVLVREEYMGGTAAIVHTVRAPMARYLIQAFRAAIYPKRETAPDYLLMVDDPTALPRCALW